MRITLIRHPRPDVAPGICYGRSDLAPGTDSAECAARLRAELPAHLPVFTSPLRRCLELARALHAQPVVDPRLIEMNFGTWEMRAWSDIPRSEIDAWSAAPLDYTPPGGEPVTAVRERVRGFLKASRAEGDEDIVVVSHAGVMKLFAAECLGLATDEWLSMTFNYGETFVIDLPE
jgi:alpha-ribazole phosphatase